MTWSNLERKWDFMENETVRSTPIVEIVRAAGFPRYSKITHCYIMHSDDYGICLRPEAYREVAKQYPEFAANLPGVKKRRRPERRKKPHAIRCRLDDAMYAIVRRWMQEDGYKTAQDFLEECIKCYGAAHGKDFL